MIEPNLEEDVFHIIAYHAADSTQSYGSLFSGDFKNFKSPQTSPIGKLIHKAIQEMTSVVGRPISHILIRSY